MSSVLQTSAVAATNLQGQSAILSTNVLYIIGAFLLVLIVAFIIYIRSGDSGEKERRLADINERLKLLREKEELEK